MAKILLHLSAAEPGENWIGETYSSVPDAEPMPGWELSVVWYSEKGLPTFGILTSTYFSGNGCHENGCIPDVDLRFSLLSTVLIRLDDVLADHKDVIASSRIATTVKDLNLMLKALGKDITWTFDYSPVKIVFKESF